METGAPAGSAAETPLQAERALLARRKVSIRSRVGGLFLVLFLLLAVMTAGALVFLSQFKEKSVFLEKMGNYAFEIQQARRYEKNFFLYGTNLPDALENIDTARTYLERASEGIRSVVGDAKYRSMSERLTRYEGLLESLAGEKGRSGPSVETERRRIEIDLRKYGAQILNDAEEMIDRERMAMHTMLSTSKIASIVFLVFMLFVMAFVAAFIIRAVLKPLGRFVHYANRIGSGDYSPILPARKYRDEFSGLALAFNQMLRELKSRQDMLIQTGKMAAVGNLTSGIAHELNNPLNNIGLNTEALLESFDDLDKEGKVRLLEQIYTQVERASSTVRNLLDFTRKEKPVLTNLSIRTVLETTARLVGNELALAGVELRLSIDDNLPQITGNLRNLEQVFLNLFLNAIQAMPDGGLIDVHAAREGDLLRIDVRDSGCGIPPEQLDRIFDPFFTTKDPGEGTGLGLSVSYGIIEKHGGKIGVESEPGEGTRFSVFLPISGDR